jgi:hypothetical protein
VCGVLFLADTRHLFHIHIFKAALEIDNYSSKLGMPICPLPNVTVGILPPTISKETIGELFGSLSEIATPSVVIQTQKSTTSRY